MFVFDRDAYERRMTWYRHARFGMFLHWGLYAIPARGEWIRSVEQMPEEPYRRYFEEFNPVDFDARRWARAAKEAGMQYVVLTAKHHDGFCLFDSQYTDWKSTNTPFGRDIVREFVDAVRAEGLRVGLYYSLLDWHHPDYPHRHDANHPDRRLLLRQPARRGLAGHRADAHGAFAAARRHRGQPFGGQRRGIRVAGGWRADAVPWRFRQPRADDPAERHPGRPRQRPGMGGVRDDERQLGLHGRRPCVQARADAHPQTGGMRLQGREHAAQRRRGRFPKQSVEILSQIGAWMDENHDSIYGCGRSDLPKPEYGRITANAETKTLYFHVYENSIGALPLIGVRKEQIDSIRYLASGAEVPISTSWTHSDYPDIVFADLGADPVLPDPVDTVLAVKLR